MEVIKCDKCGRVKEGHLSNGRAVMQVATIDQNSLFPVPTKISYAYDLCSECMVKFELFMNSEEIK
jgi:hypothetical protein